MEKHILIMERHLRAKRIKNYIFSIPLACLATFIFPFTMMRAFWLFTKWIWNKY